MRFLNLSIFLLLLLSLGSIGWAADGWHTLHGNWQRHGYYADGFPAKNLKLIWRKELYKELTGPRAEVIVGGGLAYMGTYAGNMYAWDAQTGEKRWVFQAGGAIGHSPTYHEGILYFGSMDGRLYAVDTLTGEEKWHVQTCEGIWTSPVIHQNLVLFGSRDHTFYALKSETGQLAWSFETNGPILQSASITEDGTKVLFASEDMHLYCLAVDDGALVWQTPKLPGLSFRDYFPVIIGETILLTTNPVKDFHTILGENQQMLLK
ncbi:PQQ-binding-like beta-propeller repeat protein, partial [bacterium]|nr:PQQ-binding-like beta-propeller repeat protein [bacterium]